MGVSREMRFNFYLSTTNPEVREFPGTNPFTRKPIVRREKVGLTSSEREAIDKLLASLGAIEHERLDGREALLIRLSTGANISVAINQANGSIEFDEYQPEVAKVIHQIATAGNLSIAPSALPEIIVVTKCYPTAYMPNGAVVHETPESLDAWLKASDWPWAENPPM